MTSTSRSFGLLLFVLVTAAAGWWSLAGANKEDAKPATMAMSRYLVFSPHTQEECLAALDAAAAHGKDSLAQWDWGCMSGDHTGYMFTMASSEGEALKMVPEPVRAKARVVKVSKFTAEEIQSFHKMHH